MTACKKFKRGKEIAIEDLYQNKNFVPPKEQNLETIFEEPKQTKDGAPILTSTRKYKRYLDFDPITGKVQKPKKKRKRCLKRFKGKTRSATKAIQNIDISAVLETLSDDSSDECKIDFTYTTSVCKDSDHGNKDSMSVLPIESKIMHIDNDHVISDSVVITEDETVRDDELCKKCNLVKKCCSCELVLYDKVKEENDQLLADDLVPSECDKKNNSIETDLLALKPCRVILNYLKIKY